MCVQDFSFVNSTNEARLGVVGQENTVQASNFDVFSYFSFWRYCKFFNRASVTKLVLVFSRIHVSVDLETFPKSIKNHFQNNFGKLFYISCSRQPAPHSHVHFEYKIATLYGRFVNISMRRRFCEHTGHTIESSAHRHATRSCEYLTFTIRVNMRAIWKRSFEGLIHRFYCIFGYICIALACKKQQVQLVWLTFEIIDYLDFKNGFKLKPSSPRGQKGSFRGANTCEYLKKWYLVFALFGSCE